ncbi:MAG: hypothetical protein ACJ763_16355 [Bdellovibrionia bacterium]
MKSSSILFLGISILVLSPFALVSAAQASEDLVSIPVQKGESLMEFVERTHPCPFHAGDNTLQKVLRYNTETVGADGKFTLAQKEISVPRSFLTTATSCREPASVVQEKAAAPLLLGEGHGSGGGEGVVLNPTELTKREHGEETRFSNVVKVGTFLEYSKLNANSFSGNSADLTSKPEYGFNIEYDRWINRLFFLGAHFKYAHTAFQELDGRELKEESTSANSVGVTAGYDVGPKTILTVDISGEQIDHVTFPEVEAGETPLVYVQKFWVPKLTFGVKSVFVEVAGFEVGGGIAGSLYLPARGIAKTSPSESAEVFVERELNPFVTVELGLGAQFVRQGFVDGTHSYTSYGADFGLGFHF